MLGNSIIEIDTDIIVKNMEKVRRHVGGNVEIMAVLKGNAYGHGILEMARLLTERCGIRHLGVAQTIEAKWLIDGGIDPETSILVMGGIPDNNLPYAVAHGLIVPLYRAEDVEKIARQGAQCGKKPRVHIKIDTGLCRIGAHIGQELADLLHALTTRPNVIVDGIYTHFSDACYSEAITCEQTDLFRQAIVQVHAAGFHPKYIHAANTGATVCLPYTHFNMVRTGLSWLGYDPCKRSENRLGLKPAIRWTAFLTSVRAVPPNTPIGYGRSVPLSYMATESRIAIGSFGYSDGYPGGGGVRAGYVLIRGKRAPIVQVSMDQTFLDVTGIPGSCVGDEVVLLGKSGEETITAVDVCDRAGTSFLEMLSGITQRPARRYLV